MEDNSNGHEAKIKLIPATKEETKKEIQNNIESLKQEIEVLQAIVNSKPGRFNNDLKKAVFELGLSHSFMYSKLKENDPNTHSERNLAYKMQQLFLEALRRNGILEDYINFVNKAAKKGL